MIVPALRGWRRGHGSLFCAVIKLWVCAYCLFFFSLIRAHPNPVTPYHQIEQVALLRYPWVAFRTSPVAAGPMHAMLLGHPASCPACPV